MVCHQFIIFGTDINKEVIIKQGTIELSKGAVKSVLFLLKNEEN